MEEVGEERQPEERARGEPCSETPERLPDAGVVSLVPDSRCLLVRVEPLEQTVGDNDMPLGEPETERGRSLRRRAVDRAGTGGACDRRELAAERLER